MSNDPGTGRRDLSLASDCASCFGLCCVALPFARSADFPVDKAGGEPCVNLDDGFRCGIHTRLRATGYRGCTVFECFGAGQQVSQVTFGGVSWREEPGSARQMYDVFAVMRQLHEMLFYLAECEDWSAAAPVRREVAGFREEIERLVRLDAVTLERLDVAALRGGVGEVLGQASALARSGVAPRRRPPGIRQRIERGADLMGASLRGADLQGADLRGSYLIAADLRGADLRLVDLLGADLRDADVRGTDLSTSLFLTQPQVNAAKGDHETKIPSSLPRPEWWRA